jgi:hypothetical protein
MNEHRSYIRVYIHDSHRGGGKVGAADAVGGLSGRLEAAGGAEEKDETCF